jgi:hypothetical protein
MTYKQGTKLTLKNESGHIEIQPTLMDYYLTALILFGVFNVIYWVIQLYTGLYR